MEWEMIWGCGSVSGKKLSDAAITDSNMVVSNGVGIGSGRGTVIGGDLGGLAGEVTVILVGLFSVYSSPLSP